MEEENKTIEENNNKNSSTKVIAITLIIIAVVVLIGTGVALLFVPRLSSTTSNNANNNNIETATTTDKTNSNDDGTTNDTAITDETKSLNLGNSLNTTNYKYTEITDKNTADKYFKLKINEDQKSATLTISDEGCRIINREDQSVCKPDFDVNISGFNKSIKSTYIGGIGQSIAGTIFYFLMEDGTVEYVRYSERKINEDNTIKYEDAYNKKPETIPEINDIVKLYGANAYPPETTGASTTLAVKSDGNFYDLSQIL